MPFGALLLALAGLLAERSAYPAIVPVSVAEQWVKATVRGR